MPASTTFTTPTVPASNPELTGPSAGTSGEFAVKILSIKADHDLDSEGYSGPPSLGVAIMAHCSEPEEIVTWEIAVGSQLVEQTVGDCFEGSFNTGSIPLTLSVVGCGPHVLTLTPRGFGPSVTSTTEHSLAPPIRIPFKLC